MTATTPSSRAEPPADAGLPSAPDARVQPWVPGGDGGDDPVTRLRAVLAAAVPTGLRGGRLALSGPAVVGLVVIAAIAVGVAAAQLWRDGVRPVELAPARSAAPALAGGTAAAPVRAGSGAGTMPSAGAGPAAATPSAGAGPAGPTPAAAADRTGAMPAVDGEPARLLVHVVGRVRRPGVVALAPGARVADAVAAAGGASAGADLAALNLARPVTDGEQVRVPAPGESPAPVLPPLPASALSGAGSAPAGVGGSATAGAAASERGPAPGDPLDLNTATLDQLDALPGLGPVLAQRILDWRAQHGGFRSVEELQEVAGIGPATFAELAPRVRV